MRILGISGSLRRGSHNTALLRAAAERLPAGAELRIFDRLRAVPPYDADDDPSAAGGAATGWPPAVERLRRDIRDADAILIATPEYNHSIPGQLKNALDWVSRPAGQSLMRDKPVAVIGASTGAFGAVWAQAELRKVAAALGVRVVDAELPVSGAHERIGPDGKLRLDGELAARLDETLAELAAAGEREDEPVAA